MFKKTLVVLLCYSSVAFANPVVKLTGPERAHLNQMRKSRESRGAHAGFTAEEVHDQNNARLFLCLCEESDKKLELRQAISAVDTIYSANPSASSTHNGKPYKRLLISNEYKAVVRHLFRHPEPEFQERAAALSSDCIWGDHPDPTFFPLLDKAFQTMEEGNRRRNVLSTYGDCHAPLPEVARAIVRGLQDRHPAVLEMALAIVSKRFRKGTDYGRDFRRQATPLIKACLKAPESDVRAGAVRALFHMNPGDGNRKMRQSLLSEQLKDPHGGVVTSALRLIEDDHCSALIPAVSRLLDDQRPSRTEYQSMKTDRDSASSGDDTPVCHFALQTLDKLSHDEVGPRGFDYKFSKTRTQQSATEYRKEAARAREWLKRNAHY